MNVSDLDTTIEMIDYINDVLKGFINNNDLEVVFWLTIANTAMSSLTFFMLGGVLIYDQYMRRKK